MTPDTSINSDKDVDLDVRLHNSGKRAGREVVQLYAEPPHDDPSRPPRTLAGFANVAAEPGESVEARVTLRAQSFMCFDESAGAWVNPPGSYTIQVAHSSRYLRLKARVVVG